jgi:AcrR family transcriptional regulator
MSRDSRIAMMLDQAAPVLADRGLSVSTRDLATNLGVTQALIYKHFSSKEAFISAALARVFVREMRDPKILKDVSKPLAERLTAFYSGRTDHDGGTRIRLFIRAALEGWPIPARRGAALTREVFDPVISALRDAAGLAPVEERPMIRGERELAMMLHGSIVFHGIRKHVYRMPMPDDRGEIIRLYVETFVPGALETLRRLHGGAAGENLTVEQLSPAKW